MFTTYCITSIVFCLGLSDFNEGFAVVVVGGCEGSAVLGVVDVQARHLLHRLQLKVGLLQTTVEGRISFCLPREYFYSVTFRVL